MMIGSGEISKTPFQQKLVSFIGDDRSGRSTLVGRYIDPTERDIEKCINVNTYGFFYPTRLDAYRRFATHTVYPDRAKKIKIALSHKPYKNDNELITLMDVSSEKSRIDCLLKSIWLSNICVLVVDVTPGVFERDFDNPIGNIRTQLQIVAAVGLTNLIVCLSKCDVLQKQDLIPRLEKIKSKLNTSLVWKNVPFIPVSCKNDENIFSPFYNEFSKGKSFESTLRSIHIEPRKDWIEKPLMMVIFEVYKIGGVGTVIAGKIISGKIMEGQQVYYKDETSNLLKSIEIAFECKHTAICGEFCGINIKNVSKYELKSHFIIYDHEFREKEKEMVESFRALIKIMHQPKNGIKVGYTFKLYYAVTNCCLCKIEDIFHTVNPKTNHQVEVYPTSLKKGDFAEVRLKPLITAEGKSCFLKAFEQNEVLGRVVMMNGKQLIGAGKVLRIN